MTKLRAAFNAAKQVSKREALPAEDKLLSRQDFDRLVKARSMGYCVCCNERAVDSHHILDRKLFTDGGYYLGNGAALCEEHHKQAEATLITVEEVRSRAHIGAPVLPPGFEPGAVYDKWGNRVISEHVILLGPLALDLGCRRALIAGRKAHLLYETLPYLINEVKT